MRLLLTVIPLLVASGLFAQMPRMTLENKDGVEISGKFLRLSEDSKGNQTLSFVLDSDGQRYLIPMDSLSEDSQRAVRAVARGRYFFIGDRRAEGSLEVRLGWLATTNVEPGKQQLLLILYRIRSIEAELKTVEENLQKLRDGGADQPNLQAARWSLEIRQRRLREELALHLAVYESGRFFDDENFFE